MNAPAAVVHTTCPYCGVGCGIDAEVRGAGDVRIRGTADHPANRGRLCSKGAALAETLDLEGRLLAPEIRGRPADWDTAIDLVAGSFTRIIAESGPDAVALYVSGQLLTEDYYVANKWMKGCIGSANIDTNSRLCMASSVAGHRRAFGTDTVPCDYADIDHADLLVLVGSNAAWCHPVLWQRMLETRRRRPQVRIVVIDPRRTATAADADLFLQLRPGTDTVLFNGLLNQLRMHDALDWDYLEHHTSGMADALRAARMESDSVPAIAAACGLEEARVAEFCDLFRRTDRVVTCYSQGVNQSTTGTDKVNAIINCHLATGRIARPGMGPFSLTGQPNAMGGREVGGLANQLAAHMDIENAAHRDCVQRFWNAPRMASAPGPKAVDMFRAVAEGRIRAIWIMGTNPVVSMPDADAVRAALAACELVVVSDCVRATDTTAHARVLLPALAWGEKDGTVTNSERRISRQRAFLSPPGLARADWWIVCRVAERMGFGAWFPYAGPAAIFREHAALSGFENHGRRAFDIGALADLADADYDRLAPVQWPLPAGQPSRDAAARPFADRRFFHDDGRARLVAVTSRPSPQQCDAEFPLLLNTGRSRDHWHTLTRTGMSPRLSAHTPFPVIELHPRDAARHGIDDGALVRVRSRRAAIDVCAAVTDSVRPGEAFVPMHWTDRFASRARVDALAAGLVDAVSGQPELKHTPVAVAPLQSTWEGFLCLRHDGDLPSAAVWMRNPGRGFTRYRVAGTGSAAEWSRQFSEHAGFARDDCEYIEYRDAHRDRYRAAWIRGERLQACLFMAPSIRELPASTWVGELFADKGLASADRRALLSGRPGPRANDRGDIVCACHAIGKTTISAAIAAGADSVEALGVILGAGTECGSCRPELRAMLNGSVQDRPQGYGDFDPPAPPVRVSAAGN